MQTMNPPVSTVDAGSQTRPGSSGPATASETGASSARTARRITTPVTREVMLMVGKIALIIFTIEMIIMFILTGWDPVGFIDAATLTTISSPIIYRSVAHPFAEAARAARASLSSQLDESQRLLEQNEKLTASIQAFSENTAETHEQVLQKIGADLHDSPAQLLSFALLKLDRLASVVNRAGEEKAIADLQKLRSVLTDTLREVREISTGLSLPELGAASMEATILLSVRRHEELTGHRVIVSMEKIGRAHV